MEFTSAVIAYGMLLSALFAAVCVWGQVNNYGRSWQWNVLALMGSLIIFMGFEGMASQPKPMYLELWKSPSYEVLHYVAYPNDTIYLWVIPKGQSVPRSYSIPWSRNDEEGLAENLRLKRERGIPPDFYYAEDRFVPHAMPEPIELEPKEDE